MIDEFCKLYEDVERHKLIDSSRSRDRSGRLSPSEMMTIMVIFHMSPCRNFKFFYTDFLQFKHGKDFPDLVCYERFVQLMPSLFVPLSVLLHSLMGEKTGVYFMDSTHLKVCHNKRINCNKVFSGLAARSKTTMGCFFGFKLHIVINEKGQIVAVRITPGNTDDRKPVATLTKALKGFVFADSGYISQKLFDELYARGLKIITGIRKGMKNHLTPIWEKLMRRKRFIVETVFNVLKIHTNLDHTRHRAPINFLVNILAALLAYCFKTNKPKITPIKPKHSYKSDACRLDYP